MSRCGTHTPLCSGRRKQTNISFIIQKIKVILSTLENLKNAKKNRGFKVTQNVSLNDKFMNMREATISLGATICAYY
jgi:prefoldin subunit 5